jgi:hypothetical protein
MHRSFLHTRPRGVSLIEAVISATILALCVATIFQGMHMGYYSALRSTRTTESLARVTKRFEDINYVPYDSVTTNRYPVEYVTSTSSTAITLVYAITTSVRTVLLPIEYKVITIDAAWRVRDNQRAARYFTIRTP